MKKCTYCGKEYTGDETVCVLDGEPVVDATAPPQPPPPQKSQKPKKDSAHVSLILAVIAHGLWLIPMVAGNMVFHIGNQGFAELIPLAGLPIAIIAVVYAVRGFKTKKGFAIAGLILAILAFMLCVSAIFALPGPLQPILSPGEFQ